MAALVSKIGQEWAFLAVLGFLMAMCMWDICLTKATSEASEAAEPPTVCFREPSSPTLDMFVDKLPIPPVLNAATGRPIRLGAYKIRQKLHRDLPSTTLYAFGTSWETAHYPGPTLEARRYVPTRIRWENHIEDDNHFLPVDYTLRIPELQKGGVPIVVHLHGAETESYADGNPDAWFTSRGETGRSYVTQNYMYPNAQNPTMLWYHDHTLGINRLNIAAGLFGIYILRSPSDERNLVLPSGPYEIPLIFQDKRFFANGNIRFPNVGATPQVHHVWCLDYFGDTMLVNGKVWPFLNVEPRKYRFRMVNADTERFLLLSLMTSEGSGLSFIQIGSDGGYLYRPQRLQTMLISTAERFDVIVDFTNFDEGTEIFLLNSARSPFPNGANPPGRTRTVMKFVVVAATARGQGVSNPQVPSMLRNQSSTILRLRGAERVRRHQLIDVFSSFSTVFPVELLLNYRDWRDPPTEIVRQGSTEVWEIINLTQEAHPIHVHLVSFQVLNLQRYDVQRYTNQSCSLNVQYPNAGTCFLARPQPPMSTMVGWKDTVTALPNIVTRIVLRFATQEGTPYPFDATSAPGYLWHCHLLGHEDNEMMRPMLVT